jgi:hypothetical protein
MNMKVTIPNPNKPAEAEQIQSVMSLLEDCQRRDGGFDVIMLGKWLEYHKDEIWAATDRLIALFEELYPPTVIETVEAAETVKEVAA